MTCFPFFRFAIGLLLPALAACGGHFSQTPDDPSGHGGSAGAGGMAGNPDSGSIDATVLVDGNDSRCPSMAPRPYDPCLSEAFICDYEDGQGCPRRFMCIATGSSVVTGVGGAFPPTGSPVWIAQSPMPGDACRTPGKICNYPESYPPRLVCTEAHTWEATTSTTTIGTTSTTTEGSTTFTVGSAGVGSGSGGQGGADNTSGTGGFGASPR